MQKLNQYLRDRKNFSLLFSKPIMKRSVQYLVPTLNNLSKTNKVLLCVIVSIAVFFNIMMDHVHLDSNSSRISIYYYIFRSGFSPEFLIATTALYPLIVITLSFFTIPRVLYFILGLSGVFFTILLWILMNLHFDAKIISRSLVYYVILGMELLFSLVCFMACFVKSYKSKSL